MKRISLSILLLSCLGVLAFAEPLGWVSSEEKSFDCGQTITIAANPEAGYTFSQWSDGITDNPREVYVGQEQTFIAEFAASPATGLDNTDANTPSVRKVLINDHIFIIRDDKVYSIQGELVH